MDQDYVILRNQVHITDPSEPHRTLCGQVYGNQDLDSQTSERGTRGWCRDCVAKNGDSVDLVIAR